MLISLFTTARRFNMEVQPSLVLLQKTLLNIEGLGRQMYPQLDLWATAQPFLDKWLKDRYSPKSIFKQFKRHVPDWLEHLPQIPPLVFQALQNMQTPETSAPSSEKTPVAEDTSKLSKLLNRLGAALVGIGVGIGFSNWSESMSQLPGNSLILVSVGLLLLLLR